MAHRPRRIAATAAWMALAAPAAAAPAVITQPDWLAKPTAEALAEHYPPLAAQLGIAGYAQLNCTVAATGELVDCRAAVERPVGLEFGQAAMALGSEFRMRPKTVNGQPVDGGEVRIPIRFVLPPKDPVPALPAPVSAEAAKQARRVVEATRMLDQADMRFEAVAKQMESMVSDADLGHAAAEAYRHGVRQHRSDFREAYARAFASVFSEAELAAIADYSQATADQAKANEAFAKSQALVMVDYVRDLAATGQAAFCAKVRCLTAADVQRVWRPADPRDTGRIDIPQWAAEPDGESVGRAQPKVLGALGVSGLARLSCTVAPKGELKGCTADDEAPVGLGYGAAALTLAEAYRLSPLQLLAGAAGRRVTVRVGFAVTDLPKPLSLKPGAARAAALAHQIVAADTSVSDDARLQTELQITDFTTNVPKGADPKIYALAVDAYRTGAQKALADFLELSAANLTANYSEAQLAARAAFAATPAGKAQAGRSKELGIALENADSGVEIEVEADARTEFCKVHDCATPAPPAAARAPSPAQPKAVSSAPSTAKP